MKKIVSLLLCSAMVFGFLPRVSHAAEADQNGVKIGIRKGDIVGFAGKDKTPIQWRVLDAEKSNSGDQNGMLLLSEDTVEEVADNSTSYSLDRLNTVYKSFYDKYFSEPFRSAVIPTTLKNTSSSSILGYEDELKNDTVFSLSKSEAENLTVEERKFKDKKWLLRTVRERSAAFAKYDFTYVDFNGKVESAAIGNDHKTGYSFRPAVNIDKTKLAQLDGKPLLLPFGEYSEADNRLAALGGASEWKLTQKDNSVKITTAKFSEKENHAYEITVGTDLENPDDNDYISLIILRGDGSVSHYGRYSMTAAENTFTITLPEDYSKANDSVYVFYENDKGALSGSAGEMTEICLHDYSCASVDDQIHRYTCKRCAHSYDENHQYGTIPEYAGKEVGCLACDWHDGFMVQEVSSGVDPVFGEKNTSVRTEYDSGSLKFSNCYCNSYAKYYFLRHDTLTKELTTYAKGQRAVVTFQTTTPIRATGFRIITEVSKIYIPTNIILYGKKGNSDDDYKKIGSAFLKPILPEKTGYINNTFAFLFTDQTNFAAYDSFKLEIDNESSTEIKLRYFGLLSDQGSSFSVSADGAMVDGAAPGKAYPGEDFSLALISRDGHPKYRELQLTVDGEAASSELWSYSEDTGIFTLHGESILGGKNYALHVACEDRSINVDIKSNYAVVIERDQKPEYGKDFHCVFRDGNEKTYYAPGKEDIQVLCGGNDITKKCSYTNYTLTIPGQYVRGDIQITANESYSVQKETSNTKIEKPGEPTRWYDNVFDAGAHYIIDRNDGVLVVATYVGNRMNGIACRELTEESSGLSLYDILQMDIYEVAHENMVEYYKLYFWNSLSGIVPLSEAATISSVLR